MLRLYHGLQGGGKTYGMIFDLVQLFREGKRPQVYSNIASLKVPEARYFCDIEEIIDLSDGLILLDEVGIVMPAQFWHDLGRDLLVRLCQLRHDGLDCWYTSQRQNGVNVNMREQTNQTVNCSRVGPFIYQQTSLPERKAVANSRFIRVSPRIYQLYDTHTNISRSGDSVEARQTGARSLASRRLAERRNERDRARAKPVESLLYEPMLSGWWGAEHTTLRLRDDAAAALKWLMDEGHFMAGVHWSEQVRAELRRREWLGVFGMQPDEAPLWCTMENPWLDGYDPATVRRKWKEKQRDLAEHEAAIKSVRTRSRRGAAAA